VKEVLSSRNPISNTFADAIGTQKYAYEGKLEWTHAEIADR
jgi:hypothetical protein